MHFKIEEYHRTGYPARTIYNVQNSDMTLAIATNFETVQELITYNTCVAWVKHYGRVDLNNLLLDEDRITALVKVFNQYEVKTLNIAGNGIYSLYYKQHEVDLFVYNLLKKITTHPLLKNRIELIRTGGQTGVDEAGAKAGYRLAIQTVITAPKGFMFRGDDGVDISDKVAFVSRFDDCIKLVYPLPVDNKIYIPGGFQTMPNASTGTATFKDALKNNEIVSVYADVNLNKVKSTLTPGFDFSEGGFREDRIPTPEENINFPGMPDIKHSIVITSRLAAVLNKIRK